MKNKRFSRTNPSMYEAENLNNYLPQLRTFRIHRFLPNATYRDFLDFLLPYMEEAYKQQSQQGAKLLPMGTALAGLGWRDYIVTLGEDILNRKKGADKIAFTQFALLCPAAHVYYAHGFGPPLAGDFYIAQKTEGLYFTITSRFHPAYGFLDKIIESIDEQWPDSIWPTKTVEQLWQESNNISTKRKRKRSPKVQDRVNTVKRLMERDPNYTVPEIASILRCSQSQARYARRLWADERFTNS